MSGHEGENATAQPRASFVEQVREFRRPLGLLPRLPRREALGARECLTA
jgi:hypothetical protein